MAQFSTMGLDGLQDVLKNITNVPNDIKTEMLQNMGNTAVKYQRQSAKAMLTGPDETGITADSMRLSKVKLSADGGTTDVTFTGKRTDKRHKKAVRNAEIAFVNEFGKAGQPARPFIKKAIESHADEINKAGADVYFKWMKEKTD